MPQIHRVLLAIATLLVAFPSYAFHDGGVASCQGCHIMHESEDGMVPTTGPTGDWLLRESYPSEVCLGCHADNHGQVLGMDPLVPPPEYGGGNFVFLVEDNLNDGVGGALNPIPGHVGGHNVVAPGYGLYADPDRTAAPGGSFPSSALSCTSCHDPHGNANFRMLLDSGQQSSIGYVFTNPAPLAQGLDLIGVPENSGNHTAYRQGWADWCGNCHGMYHDESRMQLFEHPAQHGMGGDERDDYNSYEGTDDPTGGSYATAYLAEVPLESASATTTQVSGADTGSRVMCMSCHRAHATSAPKALRWDPNVTYLADDGVESGSYVIPNPYPSTTQRSLCEKCHWTEVEDGHHNLSRPCLSCHGDSGMRN